MQGYYRFPTIYKNKIVFVSEDDLWIVEIGNNKAYRLTANLSPVHSPHFSPDGKWIAYVGTEDGTTEIYLNVGNAGFKEGDAVYTEDGRLIGEVKFAVDASGTAGTHNLNDSLDFSSSGSIVIN